MIQPLARSFAELKSAAEKGLSEVGLMLFMKLDQGAVVRKETGRDMPRIIRFLVGNPLIMKGMAKHRRDAGSYAPVMVLVDERSDGAHLSYDRMSSFLAPYGNRDALQVAQDLEESRGYFEASSKLNRPNDEWCSWPRMSRRTRLLSFQKGGGDSHNSLTTATVLLFPFCFHQLQPPSATRCKGLASQQAR